MHGDKAFSEYLESNVEKVNFKKFYISSQICINEYLVAYMHLPRILGQRNKKMIRLEINIAVEVFIYQQKTLIDVKKHLLMSYSKNKNWSETENFIGFRILEMFFFCQV